MERDNLHIPQEKLPLNYKQWKIIEAKTTGNDTVFIKKYNACCHPKILYKPIRPTFNFF